MANVQTSTLQVTTPSDLEVVMTRTFDAPPELVFKAFADPELLPQWWGSLEQDTRIDQHDLRPGGQWRYVKVAPDGTEYTFSGQFREVAPPEKFATTFKIEGMPGGEQIQSTTFETHEGGTLMTFTTVFQSTEERDGTMKYGMEAGAGASYDQLAALLATLV